MQLSFHTHSGSIRSSNTGDNVFCFIYLLPEGLEQTSVHECATSKTLERMQRNRMIPRFECLKGNFPKSGDGLFRIRI